MEAFLAEIIDIRYSWTSNKNLVCAVLIPQLRSIAFARFKFDSDLAIVQEIGALEYDTKGTFSDLLSDTIMDSDNIGG